MSPADSGQGPAPGAPFRAFPRPSQYPAETVPKPGFWFRALKLPVSSLGTAGFKPWNCRFQALKLPVSSLMPSGNVRSRPVQADTLKRPSHCLDESAAPKHSNMPVLCFRSFYFKLSLQPDVFRRAASFCCHFISSFSIFASKCPATGSVCAFSVHIVETIASPLPSRMPSSVSPRMDSMRAIRSSGLPPSM